MTTNLSYTIKISPELIDELCEAAVEEKVAEAKILESVIENWLISRKKAALIAMFQSLDHEEEIAISEEGFEDVLKMIDEA